MRSLPFLALTLVLGSALSAAAEDVVSVFVTGKDGKAADLTGWTASLTLESKGLATRTAALDFKLPVTAQPRADAPEHGGHFVRIDGDLSVELVGGWSPGAGGLAPFFEGHVSLKAWECPMKCVPAEDKPGKCGKCEMDLDHADVTWTATVTFKTPAGEKVAKALSLPPPVPTTYGDAAAEAKAQLGRALMGSAALPRVRRIEQLAEALPALAAEDIRAAVKVRVQAIREACEAAVVELATGKMATEQMKTLEKKVEGLPATSGK
ncbi:MAG: hypothetical protein K8T20_08790 [Planctomycetes bacterium]|nr:hypothetical protein [Planctomycetota bacterium]